MESIPKIFVINLPHRTDRLQSITAELERMELLDKMEIIEGIMFHVHGTGTAGITEAHARCIELAKERGYEMIMILQDDCKFLVDKDKFKNEIETFLNTAPSDWNGFWFGSFWQSDDTDVQYHNQNYLKSDCFNQDTGTLIHSRFYTTLIEGYRFCKAKYIETGDDQYNIDQWIQRNNENVYVSRLKLCGQADNVSDRLFMIMNGGDCLPL